MVSHVNTVFMGPTETYDLKLIGFCCTNESLVCLHGRGKKNFFFCKLWKSDILRQAGNGQTGMQIYSDTCTWNLCEVQTWKKRQMVKASSPSL